MDAETQKTDIPDQFPQARAYEMLDEPVENPRYGGMTMRDMVRKVVLRRDDPVQERRKTDKK